MKVCVPVMVGKWSSLRGASPTNSIFGWFGSLVREREESSTTAYFFPFVLRNWKNGIVINWVGEECD